MIKKVVVTKKNIKDIFDKVYPVFKGDFATVHFWQPSKPGFIQGTKSNLFVNRDLIGANRLLNRKAKMMKENKYPYDACLDYNNVIALRDKEEKPSIFVGSRDEDSYLNIEVGDIFYFHPSGKFIYVDVDDLCSRNIGKLQLLVVPMHFNDTIRKEIDLENEYTRDGSNEFYEAHDCMPYCYTPSTDYSDTDKDNDPYCVGNEDNIAECEDCYLYKNNNNK